MRGKRKKNHLYYLFTMVAIVMFLVLGFGGKEARKVFASNDIIPIPPEFKVTTLKQAYPNMKVISLGFIQDNGKITLTGIDTTSKIAVYPVKDTTIQGISIDEKYRPSSTPRERLSALLLKYGLDVNRRLRVDCAFGDRVTRCVNVVYYDDNYAYYWSEGYFEPDPGNLLACTAGVLNEGHQPGFYRIERKNIWLNDYYGKAKLEQAGNPKTVGTGTVSARCNFYQTPGKNYKTGVVWRLANNKKVKVISPKPIAATDGSGDTYYQVRFNDKGYVYIRNEGIYYINTKYVNLRLNGEKVPTFLATATVDPLTYAGVNIRTQKSTSAAGMGYLEKGSTIDVIAKDGEWATVYYSGKTGYLQTKYLTNFVYPTYHGTVKNVKLKSFKKKCPVIQWTGNSGADSYVIEIKSRITSKKTYVVKQNTFTVPAKYMKDLRAPVNIKIYERIKSADGSTILTSDKYTSYQIPSVPNPMVTKRNLKRKGKKVIYTVPKKAKKAKQVYKEIKYADNKKFKRAKTVKKVAKRKMTLKGISKNKYYYYKVRSYYKYKIGKKTYKMYSAWSRSSKYKL